MARRWGRKALSRAHARRAARAPSRECRLHRDLASVGSYYGLRDYGTGEWTGGDETCPHQFAKPDGGQRADRAVAPGRGVVEKQECRRCGARRVDHQIGLEATPAEFLAALVAVFRECRRVLADRGTCWVNMGDSYVSNPGSGYANGDLGGLAGAQSQRYQETMKAAAGTKRAATSRMAGLPGKNLLGMPWRLAFALQDDGWILRRDVIWSKPNPMPESVTDRCTSAHEYVFQLTKRPRYWYDADAVREAHTMGHTQRRLTPPKPKGDSRTGTWDLSKSGAQFLNPAGRNLRSVWEIATQPTPEAHFATYPEELVRRCILAGCPLEVCNACGKPRERITRTEYENPGNRTTNGPRSVENREQTAGFAQRLERRTETLGWSDCGHGAYRKGRVLDPFVGSGTTCKVARDHGRHSIGIDLNAEYLAIAAKRLQQLSLINQEGAA